MLRLLKLSRTCESELQLLRAGGPESFTCHLVIHGMRSLRHRPHHYHYTATRKLQLVGKRVSLETCSLKLPGMSMPV